MPSPGRQPGLCAGRAAGGAGSRAMPGLSARPGVGGREIAAGCPAAARAHRGQAMPETGGSAAEDTHTGMPAAGLAAGGGVGTEAVSDGGVPAGDAGAADGGGQVPAAESEAGWQEVEKAAVGVSRGDDAPGSSPKRGSASRGHESEGAADAADEHEALQELWRVLRSGDAADVRMAMTMGWQRQAYSKLRMFLTPQEARVPAEAALASAAQRPSPVHTSGGGDSARGPALRSRTAERGAGHASRAKVARAAAVMQLLRALLQRLPQPNMHWTVLLVQVRAWLVLRAPVNRPLWQSLRCAWYSAQRWIVCCPQNCSCVCAEACRHCEG